LKSVQGGKRSSRAVEKKKGERKPPEKKNVPTKTPGFQERGGQFSKKRPGLWERNGNHIGKKTTARAPPKGRKRGPRKDFRKKPVGGKKGERH